MMDWEERWGIGRQGGKERGGVCPVGSNFLESGVGRSGYNTKEAERRVAEGRWKQLSLLSLLSYLPTHN